MKKFFVLLLFPLLLSACGHVLTQKERDDFQTRQDEVAFDSKKTLPPSSKTRLSLKAGQWAIVATKLFGSTGEVQAMSFSKHKVLHVGKDSLTMEIETTRAGSPDVSVTAMVVDHFPVGKQMSWTKPELDKYLDNIEFKRIVNKVGNRAPTELPLAVFSMSKSFVKNLFVTGYRIGDVHAEPCAADVLSSSKCVAYDYVIDMPGFTDNGHVDAHSAVPVVGFVRQKGGRSESQVIAYGLSGAKGILIQ